MTRIAVVLCLAIGLGLSTHAAAQAVRCEGADGKVTYANSACPDGTRQVRALPPPDAPNTQDARAAAERAKRDQQQVQKLDREQRAADDKQAKMRAAADKQAADRERGCRKLALRVTQAEEAVSKSVLARRNAAEQRLQKAREQYAADCGK